MCLHLQYFLSVTVATDLLLLIQFYPLVENTRVSKMFLTELYRTRFDIINQLKNITDLVYTFNIHVYHTEILTLKTQQLQLRKMALTQIGSCKRTDTSGTGFLKERTAT
jgi:hypothetical protein